MIPANPHKIVFFFSAVPTGRQARGAARTAISFCHQNSFSTKSEARNDDIYKVDVRLGKKGCVV